jgi:hypothetical protein
VVTILWIEGKKLERRPWQDLNEINKMVVVEIRVRSQPTEQKIC